MRKLALSHEILMSVEKPARYLGNELNAVHKELAPGMVRFACIATVIIGKLVTHKKLFVRLPEDAFPGEALWNAKFNSSSETVELPMEEIARMLASATDETQNKDENENE